MITLNGIIAHAIELHVPYRGVWHADLEIDPDDISTLPSSGSAKIVISGDSSASTTIVGTIDPTGTGSFGNMGRIRVIGGAGGWGSLVSGTDLGSSSPLSSTVIFQAVAAKCGETVSDLSPVSVSSNWCQIAGPASAVFNDREWWVDPATGVTMVGQHPPVQPDQSLLVTYYHPDKKMVEGTCDVIVLPGTVISDSRIGETPVTISDVEQTFDPQIGSRFRAWCSVTQISRINNVLTAMIRSMAKTSQLKSYWYRIVNQDNSGKLSLQIVDKTQGAPDQVPIEVIGPSGVSAKYTLATECLVLFAFGDPRYPEIIGFRGTPLPVEATVDAQNTVHVGPTVSAVQIAGAGNPIARVGDPVSTTISSLHVAALMAAGSVLITAPPSGGPCVVTPGPSPLSVTLPGIITAGSTKGSCGG